MPDPVVSTSPISTPVVSTSPIVSPAGSLPINKPVINAVPSVSSPVTVTPITLPEPVINVVPSPVTVTPITLPEPELVMAAEPVTITPNTPTITVTPTVILLKLDTVKNCVTRLITSGGETITVDASQDSVALAFTDPLNVTLVALDTAGNVYQSTDYTFKVTDIPPKDLCGVDRPYITTL